MCKLCFLVICSSIILRSVNGRLETENFQSLYRTIFEDEQYLGFLSLIKNNRIAKLNLHYYDMTVFVPTNEAIHNDHHLNHTDAEALKEIVSYHMSFNVKTYRMLENTVQLSPANVNGPPLWISKNVMGEIFVNNAKIIKTESIWENRRKQVLHVIDRVLNPFSEPNSSTNFTALDLVENSHLNWHLSGETTRKFAEKLHRFDNERELYSTSGAHTFFLPVDHLGNHNGIQYDNIDDKVLRAHIIPNRVLFIRPTMKNVLHSTEEETVQICLENEQIVKSYTEVGGRESEIISDIVLGNIPLSNGVAHLISKPLVIREYKLKPFPFLPIMYKISSDPDLNLTYLAGKDSMVNSELESSNFRNNPVLPAYTYFAVTNKGWRSYLMYNYDKSMDDIVDILPRFVVVGNSGLTMDELEQKFKDGNGILYLATLDGTRRKIKIGRDTHNFWIETTEGKFLVTRKNYVCSDGIVHLIEFAEKRPIIKGQTDYSSSMMVSIWNYLYYFSKIF